MGRPPIAQVTTSRRARVAATHLRRPTRAVVEASERCQRSISADIPKGIHLHLSSKLKHSPTKTRYGAKYARS